MMLIMLNALFGIGISVFSLYYLDQYQNFLVLAPFFSIPIVLAMFASRTHFFGKNRKVEREDYAGLIVFFITILVYAIIIN